MVQESNTAEKVPERPRSSVFTPLKTLAEGLVLGRILHPQGPIILPPVEAFDGSNEGLDLVLDPSHKGLEIYLLSRFDSPARDVLRRQGFLFLRHRSGGFLYAVREEGLRAVLVSTPNVVSVLHRLSQITE